MQKHSFYVINFEHKICITLEFYAIWEFSHLITKNQLPIIKHSIVCCLLSDNCNNNKKPYYQKYSTQPLIF